MISGEWVEIKTIEDMMSRHIPEGTVLTIREMVKPYLTGTEPRPMYVYSLRYTSAKSGRTMCVTAKGNDLPRDEKSMWFYLRQIVLTPAEVSMRFNIITWRERKMRQEQWLYLGKDSRKSDGTGDLFEIGGSVNQKDNTHYRGVNGESQV